MSKRQYKDFKEVYIVQFLGEKFGYGHIMAICHELWVRQLEKDGFPIIGAHIPVSVSRLKDEYQALDVRDPVYKNIVDRALGEEEDDGNVN